MKRWYGFLVVSAISLGALGVLSLYQTTTAAPPEVRLPFANSVEQRFEMIRTLSEIRDLLKEQNVLLQSGKVRVMLVEEAKI